MSGVITVSAGWLAEVEQTLRDFVSLMKATDLGPDWDRKMSLAVERAHELLDQDEGQS